MTATTQLTSDLQRQVKLLADDLLARVDEDRTLRERWDRDYQTAKDKDRTARSWTEWCEDRIDQTAVAWVLTSVFVRFCEDNRLVRPVWITGPGSRHQEALDAHLAFFRQPEHAEDTDREWLLDAFGYLGRLPATKSLVDTHSALRYASPSGKAIENLLKFWRDRDDNGILVHDLRDDTLSTRFLGDLYQDLSAHAKATYALLQTPVFVEEHILDQALEPALRERPLESFRMIDPACGSGHFLLGAFDRLLDRWHRHAPAMETQARVQCALDAIHGVDLNPFAIAIARFRLTVAALQACGLTSLEKAPAFNFHLASGDSLIHGPDTGVLPGMEARSAYMPHHYPTEDAGLLLTILEESRYDTVVGNPPYITVKDRALNQTYRSKFGDVCKGKFALTVPFMVQFFALAKHGEQSGWIGQITSNSFAKREFGVNLIEQFLAHRDLRIVEDTSGAYIPGHGTPTVIIIGRNGQPSGATLRAALGIRGEPSQPDNPSEGIVWKSITSNIGDPHWSDRWISVADIERRWISTHPWILSGGGALDLLDALDAASNRRLKDVSKEIGVVAVLGEEDAYELRPGSAEPSIMVVEGEGVRDFSLTSTIRFWPYSDNYHLSDQARKSKWMWPSRRTVSGYVMFGKTREQRGMEWLEYGMLAKSKLRTPLSIAFATVATHNHFSLDRDGRIFKQSAHVVKLPDASGEDDFLRLLGILNSSTACFWLKQRSYAKTGADNTSGGGNRWSPEPWYSFYDFNSKTLQKYPLPEKLPTEEGRLLDYFAKEAEKISPEVICSRSTPATKFLSDAHKQHDEIRMHMVSIQEELDWKIYEAYGLIDSDLTYRTLDPPPIKPGQRAFEICLEQEVENGLEATSWFSHHNHTPTSEIPSHWPIEYQNLVGKRISFIKENQFIRLLEKPEYKRRWAQEPWEKRQERALRSWLLDRLENKELWFDANGAATPKSVGQLADEVTRDADMVSVLALWEGRPDVPVTDSLQRLLADEAVPFLAACRYKDSGLRKRQAWEQTWDSQRREDKGENVGTIPVPPKYTSADFRKPSYWRARGKLDVPKERFIGYPGASRDGDRTELLGWAGWDHARQALALAQIIGEREQEGWDDARLVPLVAGLAELQPWVDQWHSETDPVYGVSLAAFCEEQLDQRARQVGMTRAELAAWRPAPPGRGRTKGTGKGK